MGSSKLVAERDGVLLKVGNEIRSLYKDGAVPDGADPAHVKVLKDRGLLVEKTEDTDGDSGGPPAKSANKDVWVDFAVSQGADRDEAEASTKDGLVATYGG